MQKWILETNELIRRRMGKTAEESNELAKVCNRILLQGISSTDPSTNEKLLDQLHDEIADVYAQLDTTVDALGLDKSRIAKRSFKKCDDMADWEALYHE